jgi:hypothetical protein
MSILDFDAAFTELDEPKPVRINLTGFFIVSGQDLDDEERTGQTPMQRTPPNSFTGSMKKTDTGK